ncbi:hypothetical protein JCM11491_006037 [Sporobolomyces phaffii]
MRRIFGGSTITGSSTSNSLSSDALSSPVEQRSPPLTPVYETQFNRRGDDEHKKGGWFGGLVRTTSTTSTPTSTTTANGAGAKEASAATRAGLYEDLDAERLPFGASRSPSSSQSSAIVSPRNGHFRQTSRSSTSLGSAFGAGTGPGGSNSRPFSPEGVLLTGEGPSTTVPKDAIMIELLSGQAAIEAQDYDVLEWDQVQDLKKEHSLLANRIASLTRSVALETRLRDSAAKLVRLSGPASTTLESGRPTAPSAASSPARRQVTREQAEAQLATAQSKLDAVQRELYQVGWHEAELRTKLLRHTAGALALSARKNRDEEQQQQGFAAANPRSPTTLGGGDHHHHHHHRFDGAHFFAGNREAVVPVARGHPSSPFASPSPSQGAFAPADLEHRPHHPHPDFEAQLSRVEAEKARIAHDLAEARTDAARAHDAFDGQRALLEAKLAKAEQTARELEAEIDDLRREKDSDAQEWAARLEEVETRHRAAPEDDDDAGSGGSVGELQARQRTREVEEEQQKLVEAIGDVLRRHRTRPTLGSVLRETPSFDDTTRRDDLASYLAQTLDAHFDKLSTHVTHLDEELSTVRNDLDETRTALDSDLTHATDRHTALENELESVRLEKDLVQETLDATRLESSGFERRLESIPILEQSLASAVANETKTREEFSAAHARIAQLEAQLADTTGEHAKATKTLQDLFKALPPLDSRPLPAHTADDLGALKDAFDPDARRQLGNFIAGITSSDGKFSLEGLAERIKLLLAEDQKVVQRLAAFETEKANVEKTRKAVEDKSADLEMTERKMKDLEERIEVSSQKEVNMLERLNDLTESLEQTRSDKRKLEAQVGAGGAGGGGGDVEELRDQVADLEEELKDAKAREQKVRSQLLDELSTVQSEVSSLKTQLRQAQRKMGK